MIMDADNTAADDCKVSKIGTALETGSSTKQPVDAVWASEAFFGYIPDLQNLFLAKNGPQGTYS